MPDTAAPPPTVFVLFGATGDLAERMVLPAFAALAGAGLLPDRFRLIGNGRGAKTDEEFREDVRRVLADGDGGLDEGAWAVLGPNLAFAGGGFTEDDAGELPDEIARARRELADDGDGSGVGLVHYVALPPSTFVPYTRALAAHDLTEGARVVYEKPYGTDPADFEELDALVLRTFHESQVFRIDHFLGKAATQQLHVLRFANRLLGELWRGEHVAQVQVDVPETLDVADRAAFYDETGAMRDMLVTHLLQVAAEVALEPPAGPGSDDLLEARESVLAAFRAIDPADAVYGQAEGYTALPEVAADSSTETFVAARLWVDTGRWHDVPFLLRTGKQLAHGAQRVSLVLRRPEGRVPLHPTAADGGREKPPEVVTFDLAGTGGVEVRISALRPGSDADLTTGLLRLELADLPDAEPLPAYASLLHDVMRGDRALFTSSAGLREAWRVVAPLLERPPPVHPYPPGSRGPQEAEGMPGGPGWVTQI